jgi:general secretion pathway protein G
MLKRCFSKENQNEKNETKKQKGYEAFTFVETLAVLAIMAVLTAGCTVSVTRLVAIAKKNSAKNQIEQFSAALQTYFLDCGCFPTTEQGLNALWEKPVFYPVPEDWNGPYLERKPGKDPWGTDFEYISAQSSVMPSEVPANLPFVLISYGADKTRGNTEGGDDIVSWK